MGLLINLLVLTYYYFIAARTFVYFYTKGILATLAGARQGVRAGAITISPLAIQRMLQSSAQIKANVPLPDEVSVSREGLSGGYTGDVFRISLKWPQSADSSLPQSFVVKAVKNKYSSHLSSVLLGSAREAVFYEQFAGSQEPHWVQLPRIYSTKYSWVTGDFVIVMEDLTPHKAVLAGHLFGNQCWGANLPKELEIDPVVALEHIFSRMAVIHAKYWRDFSLLRKPWLKFVNHHNGGDRLQWEWAMIGMRRRWESVVNGLGKKMFRIAPVNLVAMEECLKNTSWAEFHRRFDVHNPKTAFTLTHGDFHAGNMMWRGLSKAGNLPESWLVDWSEAGVFCPFTDIAQFLVSNAPIDLRRQKERHLFAHYHKTLVANGVDGKQFPLEECFEKYKTGGIEKWLQLDAILASLGLRGQLPAFGVEWFDRQVEAFVQDHYEGLKQKPALMTTYCIAQYHA